jgi:hypothetical protein
VIADFTMRRRHSALLLEAADEFENVALSFCQILHSSPRTLHNMGGEEAEVKRKFSVRGATLIL